MHTSRLITSWSRTSGLWYVGLVLLAAVIPGWASDASQNGRIVFVANSTGSWQLYKINPDGSDMVRITDLASTAFESWAPNISPDGRRIVFAYGPVDSKGNQHPDLYVIGVNGSGLMRLTNDGLSQIPRWSHDGTRIVFARTSTRTGVNVIYTMRSDGTGTKIALTSDFWDSFGGFYAPSDKNIFFYSQLGGFVAAAWVMNADDSKKKRLTAPALEGFPSDVSPDGEHILVGNHGNSPFPVSNDIFVMNIDGTHLTRLTHMRRTHHDIDASYSPDGTKIAFASDRLSSNASLDLFTMNADGSEITRIATGLTRGGCPDDNCVTPHWGTKP
jgi:Tol biopolymer transport system component